MSEPYSKLAEWVFTEEMFESLLQWLHADRKQAGELYEEIRAGLIKFFEWRGCRFAEECADNTIYRVARKVLAERLSRQANPHNYFHGVARNVLREYWKINERQAVSLDLLP